MKDLGKRTIKMIVLTLAMVFGVVASRPMCAEAAVVNVNNFADLQSKLQNGYSVKLTANITVPTNESIMVDNGNVILDLNGYTIDFNQNYGIMISSQLTLKDSRVNGKIKNCAGSIINMGINAEFNLEGGELSNCEADGVMVGPDDTFNMSGGKICNSKQSGVVINSGATFNMTGGEISNNEKSGVSLLSDTVFDMTGGEISNNEEYGVECSGTFKMSGTSKICNNDGCGFFGWTNSAINMDGGEISGNHDGGAQINSVFTMTGGKIINNERTKDYEMGAGVCLGGINAVFMMSGGEISGNWLKEDTDNVSGSGVFIPNRATFKISGAPVISDNYQGGTKVNDGEFTGAKKSNVFIECIERNYYTNFIVVGKLTGAEASIGVTLKHDMYNITKNDDCVYFVKGNDEENSEYELTDSDMKVFFSDKSKYNVYLYQELNKAVLLTEWGYIATEAGNASKDSDNPTVIKLQKDYNVTNDELVRLVVAQDTYVVIDMNGHSIKKAGECADCLISNNGNLILTDNSTGNIKGCIDGDGINDKSLLVANGGVLTMDKVFICNGTGIGLNNTGTFTMNGGKICNNNSEDVNAVGVANAGTFIMNDGEISGNGSQGVYVWRGTFTMNGGIISGNNLSNNDMRGGGVFVENNAEFEMTGGEISGNSVLGEYASGGGVYNSGTFKMSGGIIKDNSVSGEGAFGGGVYTGPGFEMTGGEISGNSASGEGANGGGVYANSAVFSNNPVITGNKLGENKVNNCYFESTLYIGGELTDGAKIGISKEESESSTPTLCTSNINYQLKTSDVSKFISDDENRVLDLDEDGCAYLVDGYIVKFDSDGGSAVLKQGVAIGAKATKPEAPIKKDNLFVAWYKVDAEGNIAENAYDFDKIVENSMILKAKWAPVSVSIMGWTYGDAAKSPTVTKPEDSGAVTYEYFTDEECTDKTGTNNGATVEGGVPKNAGKYYVKATIAASEKYGNGSTIASFEIVKKEVVVSGIVAKNKTYDTTTTVEFDFENAQFDGVIDGDEVTIKSVEGAFDDANVADNKNVTISKIILDGSSIGNYKLATEGQQTSTKAKVNTKVVDNPAISFSDENIVYDGEEKEPLVTVKDGTTVIPSSEYTVSYSNNKNAAVRTAQNAPTITITDKTAGNYKVNGKATFTIAKALVAPNKPEATKEVVYTVMTVSNVELPEKWVWSDEYKDNELIVEEGVTATANYTGEDKDNYETVNAEVVIKRAACTHDGEKQIKNVVQTSCDNDGYTGDTYCVVCGEKLEEGKTVPATGHFANDLFKKQTKDVEDIALKVVEETPTPVVQKKEEVTVEDKTSEVTEIKKDSFKGSKATTVTIGKDVTTLAPGAFNGSKIKTVIIKSKKLTKNSVRNAFKGSKVKKIIVKVKVGSKKENKKYVKKYKKFFTKKNIGVKAVVK